MTIFAWNCTILVTSLTIFAWNLTILAFYHSNFANLARNLAIFGIICAEKWQNNPLCQVKKLSPDFSNRVVALNPGTKRLFESIGAWNLIQRKNSFNTMFIWDQCASSSIEFKSLEPMAHIIENDLVIDALDRVVDASTNKNLKVILFPIFFPVFSTFCWDFHMFIKSYDIEI